MAKAQANTNTDTLDEFGDFDVGFDDMDLTEEALPQLRVMQAGEAEVRITKVELTKTGDRSKYPGAPRLNFYFEVLSEDNVWPIKEGYNVPHKAMDDNAKQTAGRQLRDFCASLGFRVERVTDVLEAVRDNTFVGITQWRTITYQAADGNFLARNGIGRVLEER